LAVVFAPPKKCASTLPSSSPAKITISMSGNSGRPPPPPDRAESSSERRRRGESLT
jgi:hypothetical protein